MGTQLLHLLGRVALSHAYMLTYWLDSTYEQNKMLKKIWHKWDKRTLINDTAECLLQRVLSAHS